ncbi:hypothetical protein ABB37_01227 [Leptomonas pyrrhocoris]|uniref:PUM-HD domain-containing protein n=1 Tax=Leptomonas pyrrhocoris TaxID=157538 RepID=A0A0N0DYZ6_LEPPY|nr:hypothetical protein ABB37_01227 [Leptomonas pyrrhocoris]KPA84728.1 hypothetical protein ABB37_01227 [Leptomonas pyrrhocoris]|eukprot:XP_015663167.1 hypothetical protein ABB37_01227 [Leptomonas pyrrhocoris]
MPGMRLDFLKNPSQRVATGKSLPLQQVEAIVLYGKPAQRAKVVQKILPAVYGLALNKTTHHVLLTLLDHCDNMDRVKMLYNVRRKLPDLANSPVGNTVVQHLLEKVPTRQKKEIAEAFVLNVDEDEFQRLCIHPFGNYVAQKLMKVPECVEMVQERFLPHIAALSLHPYGMRVVAQFIDSVAEGCTRVIEALFPTYANADPEGDEEAVAASDKLDASILALFRSADESMVLTALLRHARTPAEVKDAIYAHLGEFVGDYLDATSKADVNKEMKTDGEKEEAAEFATPDFGTGSNVAKPNARSTGLENVHVYCAALEHGDDIQRADLWAALSSNPNVLFSITHVKGAVQVGVAVVRYVEEARKVLLQLMYQAPSSPSTSALVEGAATPQGQQKQLTPKKGKKVSESTTADSIVDVAVDPVRSVLLRAFIEVARELIPEKSTAELTSQAVALSQNAVSSPVLQKLVETDLSGDVAGALLEVLLKHPSIEELVLHPSACYVLESILQYAPEEVRAPLVEALSTYYASHLHHALSFAQGSRVMQKLLAYAPDATVVNAVNQLISAAAREEEEEAKIAEGNQENGRDADEKVKEKAETAEAKTLNRKEQRAINRTRHYHVLSHALVSYALHQHACYVVQALLREVRTRQLERERKLLMNELKSHVFEMSVSPWAGRVVLDAMLTAGSSQLAEAMKNVAFLRAEAWLSEVSAERKQRGNGVDPTLRNILKRQREDIANGVDVKKSAAPGDSGAEKAEPAHKKRKLFRSMKK